MKDKDTPLVSCSCVVNVDLKITDTSKQTMKAIRCNRFAALERDESGKFRLLKQWKSLRSVLSLDSSEPMAIEDGQTLPEDHVLIQTHYAGTYFCFDEC